MDKNLIKKTMDQKNSEVLHAYIMLTSQEYSFNDFIKRLEGKWHLSTGPFREKDLLGIIIDRMIISCALRAAAVSEESFAQDVQKGYLWPDALTHISSHTAHIHVSLVYDKKKDPILAHSLFSKILASLLEAESAIGVYFPPSLFEKSYYLKNMETLASGKLPTELWVSIDAWTTSSGLNLTTHGMKRFHKKEFEIVHTKKNFIESYYFLKEIISYAIINDITFKNGDTVGENESSHNELSISKGAFLDGITIKIKY